MTDELMTNLCSGKWFGLIIDLATPDLIVLAIIRSLILEKKEVNFQSIMGKYLESVSENSIAQKSASFLNENLVSRSLDKMMKIGLIKTECNLWFLMLALEKHTGIHSSNLFINLQKESLDEIFSDQKQKLPSEIGAIF